MAIQTLHDTGSDYTILSKMDGGVYSIGVPDCVIAGVGDGFTLNYSSESLNVTFNSGSEAVICGSFFKITSMETVALVPNSTIYLCANIDLSRPNGSTGAFVQRTSSNMQYDNINGNGSSRDLLLYVIQTGASGVISVIDKRNIRQNVVEDLISALSAVATTGSYDDLTDKPIIGSASLTIKRNGVTIATFGSNATSSVEADISIPTSTSQLTNNSGFSTKHGIDTSRKIVDQRIDGPGVVSWTAPEDCIITTMTAGTYTQIFIDGNLYYGNLNGSYTAPVPLLIKSGSVISTSNLDSSHALTLKGFALK